MTIVGIVGSRHFDDYDTFVRILPPLIGIRKIVSGGKKNASGVDGMAERFARESGLSFQAFPPLLDEHRTFAAAAHARNQRIVDAVEWLIALPGPESKGTYDTMRRARKKGIPVTVIAVPR